MSQILNDSENRREKIRKTSSSIKEDTRSEIPHLKKPIERCSTCKQYSNTVLLYNGHPNNSVEEYVALTHEKLSLYTGNEELDDAEEFPIHKV